MAAVTYLGFDSDLFGFKTGSIPLALLRNSLPADLNDTLAAAKKEGYRLVYLKYTGPAELAVDAAHGEFFYDTKVTFSQEIAPDAAPAIDSAITAYRTQPIHPQLYGLAYISGQHSRFKLDKNFPTSAFKTLYDIWLEKSVDGQIADTVYVYEEEGKMLGFVTIDLRVEGVCRIGLISVDENAQGKGIGRKLINAVVAKAQEKQISRILVDTQVSNEQACNFYLKTGFEVYFKEYIVNCWL